MLTATIRVVLVTALRSKDPQSNDHQIPIGATGKMQIFVRQEGRSRKVVGSNPVIKK